MPHKLAKVYDETRGGMSMARPSDRAEVKSEVLNIRITPTLKAKLEAEARISGSKLSAECETRLLASMAKTDRATSPETQRLLDEIETTIAEIERGTGERWNESVGAWAAVAEMLRAGPIMANPPKAVGAQEAEIKKLYAELAPIMDERQAILDRLEFAGLSKPKALAAATFGAVDDELREQVAALELSPAMKDRADAEISRLIDLDERQRAITTRVNRIVEPFVKRVEDGRDYYQTPSMGSLLATVFSRIELNRQAATFATMFQGNSERVSAALRPIMPFSAALGALGGASERNDDSGAADQDTL